MTVTIPTGSLMAASLAGQAVESALMDAEVLIEAVGALTDVVDELGQIPVVPVGRTAAALVGAAVATSKGRIRHALSPARGGDDSKVLLVEAVAVGSAAAERATADLRREGVDWVAVWVWRGSDVLDMDRVNADDVRICQVV